VVGFCALGPPEAGASPYWVRVGAPGIPPLPGASLVGARLRARDTSFDKRTQRSGGLLEEDAPRLQRLIKRAFAHLMAEAFATPRSACSPRLTRLSICVHRLGREQLADPHKSKVVVGRYLFVTSSS